MSVLLDMIAEWIISMCEIELKINQRLIKNI